MAEKEIKIEVIEYLLKTKKHDIALPEVKIGISSRSDVFALNGDISVYEIKTEKDTLTRLTSQLDSYKNYANRVTLVVAEKFLDKLDIEDSIGLYKITNNKIVPIREAVYQDIASDMYLEHLWGKELIELLRGYPKWYKLNDTQAKNIIKDQLNNYQIKNLVLHRLKERFAKESELIKESILNKNYEQLFPKRIIQKEMKITPLVDIPFGVINPPQ